MDRLNWLAVCTMVCGLLGFFFAYSQNQPVFSTIGELEQWPDEQVVLVHAQIASIKRFNEHAQVQLTDGNTVWAQSPLKIVDEIPNENKWFEWKARTRSDSNRFKLQIIGARSLD